MFLTGSKSLVGLLLMFNHETLISTIPYSDFVVPALRVLYTLAIAIYSYIYGLISDSIRNLIELSRLNHKYGEGNAFPVVVVNMNHTAGKSLAASFIVLVSLSLLDTCRSQAN